MFQGMRLTVPQNIFRSPLSKKKLTPSSSPKEERMDARPIRPAMTRPAMRVSSSKFVTEQRAKAREIVSSLQSKNVKLVAMDFDKTLVSIHTHGCYQGTVDALLEHFRSTFHYLIQEIIDSPAFGDTLHLCIVSFSPQEHLIRRLLQLAFRTSKTDDIIIRCSTPEFVSRIGRKDLSGKEYHLSSVSAEIARSRGKKIESNEVLLLDDDVQNILIAQNVGHRVCHIDDDVDLDVLKQLVADILYECESRL